MRERRLPSATSPTTHTVLSASYRHKTRLLVQDHLAKSDLPPSRIAIKLPHHHNLMAPQLKLST